MEVSTMGLTVLIFLAILVVWVVCGLIAAGWSLAHFQRKFPSLAEQSYPKDLRISLAYGLSLGPVAMVLMYFLTDRAHYGWMLRKPKKSNFTQPGSL